ncbi:hypothetical protein BKA61DRAFT_707506 [Leptodontidium sp. MPI-SDFR-AT-0119]|nr:hypothetical protein BKA61DRAFT_707506 [Leptodontidium sp. MPI-SDFR-AT-0119]
MASSSSSSNLMPPPPIPRKALANPIANDQNAESDSDSDTATATPSHASSPSSPRTSNISNLKQGSKSLAALTSTFLLEDLKSAVSGYQSTASYCLGGSIPIRSSNSAPSSKGKGKDQSLDSAGTPITSPPIILRFDTRSTFASTSTQSSPAPTINKITFPFHSDPHPNNTNPILTSLLHACKPATFGFNGGDVLDETYRKAGKLDAENFSTNFHPADLGILDAVQQVLLPGLSVGVGREEHRGVRAELYKLNVYSGPSGMFQKHVDTPRGATQFGSGQLLISHEGHVSIFDWSTANSSSSTKYENEIQWCAFYSDCEHEVLPVTTGHRVTLTYNLYVSEQVGGILQRSPSADPSLYPLFEGAKKMLEIPGFMSKGGTLGFYCAHQYAHTRKVTDQLMPYALKGIDAVLFAVFSSLGVKVHVRPVLDNDAWSREDVDITRSGTRFEDIVMMDATDEDLTSDQIKCNWPLEEIRNVQWLNEAAAAGWDAAMVHLRYGNDFSLSWHYSHAAIFIDIPPRGERTPIPDSGFGFHDWREEKVDEDPIVREGC